MSSLAQLQHSMLRKGAGGPCNWVSAQGLENWASQNSFLSFDEITSRANIDNKIGIIM